MTSARGGACGWGFAGAPTLPVSGQVRGRAWPAEQRLLVSPTPLPLAVQVRRGPLNSCLVGLSLPLPCLGAGPWPRESSGGTTLACRSYSLAPWWCGSVWGGQLLSHASSSCKFSPSALQAALLRYLMNTPVTSFVAHCEPCASFVAFLAQVACVLSTTFHSLQRHSALSLRAILYPLPKGQSTAKNVAACVS